MSVVRSTKIAIIAPSAPPLGGGGVTSSHYHLYRGFRKRGVDTVLLTFNEKKSVDAGPDGILRFGATKRERAFIALCSALYLKAKGSRKLAYHLVDILSAIPGVLRMNKVIRQLKPENIIMPDHCAPGLFLHKGEARLTLVAHHNPARFDNIPLIGEFCPIDVREAVALEQRVLGKVDNVIAPSRYMEEVFKDTFRFNGPVTTIHNPFDLHLIDAVEKRELRHELGLLSDSPMVYIPSAGSTLKGERFVLEIITMLADFYEKEIGFYLSGNLSEGLAATLRGVPSNARIYAPGHLDYFDNIAIVKSCNFGISPTLIENFSMAILEAGFCGLPMVVFNVGGTGEIVHDGLNGFCVPYLDVSGLIAAALRLMDPVYCMEMARSTQLHVRNSFDADKIIDRYLEFCCVTTTTKSNYL